MSEQLIHAFKLATQKYLYFFIAKTKWNFERKKAIIFIQSYIHLITSFSPVLGFARSG